jgi:hypothetical protein
VLDPEAEDRDQDRHPREGSEDDADPEGAGARVGGPEDRRDASDEEEAQAPHQAGDQEVAAAIRALGEVRVGAGGLFGADGSPS